MNDQIETYFKRYASKEQYNAWFLGSTFARGKHTNNEEVLRSIMKSYNVFASQQIRTANISEEIRSFELQKLQLVTNLFDNVCSCLSTGSQHSNNNDFVFFLIGYVDNLSKEYITT